eukprot:scaffold14838_cov19-Tisochrysis_lutea.AAC.1
MGSGWVRMSGTSSRRRWTSQHEVQMSIGAAWRHADPCAPSSSISPLNVPDVHEDVQQTFRLWPWIMQASGVQAVCFCGFALARHNVIHSSLRTLEDRGDSGRAPKQLQHKQQPSKETQQIEPKTQYHNEHEEQEELGWNNGGDANVQQRSSTTPHLQTRINAEPALAAVAAPLSASSVAGANGGFVGIDAASNTSL